MSSYYFINGLKVRVSDHEPNFAMSRIRGNSDIEIYTHYLGGGKMNILAQVEYFCQLHELSIDLFAELLADYPDEVVTITPVKIIEVTAEFLAGYRNISGRGSMKKKKRYCDQHNVCWYKMEMEEYIVK